MSVNQETELVENIANLMTRDSFNDLRITLNNGVQVEANKVILAARSTFFDEMLHHKLTTDKFLEIDVDVSSTKEMLDLVIKFFYTGKMDFGSLGLKELLDLLNLLRFFNLKVFTDVEEFTRGKIKEGCFTFEKLLILSSTAEAYQFDDIIVLMLNYLDLNISEVSKLPEVKYMSIDFLEALIQDEEEVACNNATFYSRFITFTSWVTNNEINEELKGRLISIFDLKKFSNQQLTSTVRSSKLFTESSILDIVSQSVMNLENNLQKNVTNQANQLNKLQSNLVELNAQLSKKNLDLETQAKAHTDQLRQLKKNLAKTHAEEIKKINEELQLKKQEIATLKASLSTSLNSRYTAYGSGLGYR